MAPAHEVDVSAKAAPPPQRVARSDDASPPPHTVPAGTVLLGLGADRDRGLNEEQVRLSRSQHGLNELAEEPPPPLWSRLVSQFNQLVVLILLAAAAISATMGDWLDAAVILSIVLLNGLLGFLQEERAGRALAALRRLSAPQSRVLRNGALNTVPARDLVPGDVVELEAGDHVPADARLVHSVALRVQEAALTGESSPAGKDPRLTLDPRTPLAERRNMVYMGTVVAAGKATAVVVATGMATEIGRIAGMLRGRPQEPTPLQRRLDELGKVLILVCVAAVVVIFGLQLARGGRLIEVFVLSVSLTVAAVPEGLPAVVTIALALGLQRMVRRNALIRKLPSVETLGCVTIICSDKTGTLTRNEMTVREVCAGGKAYHVTGTGYLPRGHFLRADRPGQAGAADPAANPVDVAREPGLRRALAVGAWCNNARLVPSETGDVWSVAGDPTEGALLVASVKGGLTVPQEHRRVLFEIPFDSDRKAMSVVVAGDATGHRSVAGHGSAAGAMMYTKGAPEVVLRMCSREFHGGHVRPLTQERRLQIGATAAEMAARALRVLGLAYQEHRQAGDEDVYKEEDLVFAGLAGMMDPPREEVKEAVARCRSAGIRPVMITGDHPATATAIARELGIDAGAGGFLVGRELDDLTDETLAGRVDHVAVYARVTAQHKLRVVRALKSLGHVVAMTGDGVNDAPAVDEADIGIAMGVTGTDVTKAASDMVLMDDNFATIVNAVEEGRGIFDNIQKFVHYLLASNASEVMFMLFAVLAGWPLPLLAIQILWINLVTDSLPAVGLGSELPERDVMRRPPRPLRAPVITRRRGLSILGHAALIAAAAAAAFAVTHAGDATNVDRARTAAFFTIGFAQLIYAFACRSDRYTTAELGLASSPRFLAAIGSAVAIQVAVATTPFMQHMLKLAPQTPSAWVLIAGLAAAPTAVIELLKWATRRKAEEP